MKIKRVAITEAFGVNVTLFRDLLLDEVVFREGFNKKFAGPRSVVRLQKMLFQVAERIVDDSVRWKMDPVNVLFIFLNRYYSFFLKKNALHNMAYFWDDFVVYLTHDEELQKLMNYDNTRRRMVIGIIREMQEARDSAALTSFLKLHCGGFRVEYPQHFRERSQLFEAMLRAVVQIEAAGLEWFLAAHAMEILKAHLLALKKHGNPIRLNLGNFHGDIAMSRLSEFLVWRRRSADAGSRFKGIDL